MAIRLHKLAVALGVFIVSAPAFSHIIAPRKSSHFHIFMGNDTQQSLLNEMENWPTYYPYQLSSEEVVEEMMSH